MRSLLDRTIDLGIGEARLVRAALEATCGLGFLSSWLEEELSYPSSRGNQELLRELEHISEAPTVVTAGAKHGAFIALMVAKKRGCERVGMRDPAWPPLVQAAQTLGFKVTLCEPSEVKRYDCFMLVSPNNPDGRAFSPFELTTIETTASETGKFLIHDAAYACAPYSNFDGSIRPIGDVQLHSASKRFGLSGLRVGWAVCRQEQTLADIEDLVETTTAGVCGTAQGAIARLLKQLRVNPRLAVTFKKEAIALMGEARKAASSFNPQVLEADMHLNEGAFAWCRKGPRYDATKLQALLIDGGEYGYPYHVRVNLVGGLGLVEELARRTWAI